MININSKKLEGIALGQCFLLGGVTSHIVGSISMNDEQLESQLFRKNYQENWDEVVSHEDRDIRMLVVDNLKHLDKFVDDPDEKIRRKARLYMAFAA